MTTQKKHRALAIWFSSLAALPLFSNWTAAVRVDIGPLCGSAFGSTDSHAQLQELLKELLKLSKLISEPHRCFTHLVVSFKTRSRRWTLSASREPTTTVAR